MNNILFGTIRTMISGTNRTAKAPKTGVLIAISVVLALLSLFFATCVDETPTGDTTAPSAVGTLEITAQRNASVDITWTDPDDADFSHVLITWDPPGGNVAQPFNVARGTESATITGLENGVAYTFSVATVDLTGNTSTATAAPTVTATGVPPSDTDITNLSRTSSSDGTVIILWVDPTGTDFSHVLITWDPAGGDQTQPLRVEKGIQTATITGLFAGNDYTFTVVNVDTGGMEATPTTTEPVTVMGTPPSRDAVTNVNGAAQVNGSAEITWSDPVGADFSHVLITWDPDGGIETQPVRIESGVGTATITGLTNGTEYTFSVVAVNVAGRQADAVTAVLTADTEVTVPSRLSTSTVDNSGVALTWADPSDSDLSHIQVTWSPGGGNLTQPLRIASGVEEVTILHLTAGSAVTFTVTAVDAIGHTAAAAVRETPTADTTAPADPTDVTATPRVNGAIELTWTDPADFDLADIRITWTGASTQTSPLTVAPGAETTTITGLTDATSYTFTVAARDTGGRASTGVSAGATANTSVAAVTNISATAIAGGAVAAWTDPADTTLSHVNITWSPAHGSQTQPVRVDPGTQTVSITGLTGGTPYTITATAVDTAGNEATATATATPTTTTTPAVTVASATRINPAGTTTVTWTDPSVTSGIAKIAVTGLPGPTTAVEAMIGDGTVDVTGLDPNAVHTIIIATLDSSDAITSAATATANATLPVALFRLGGSSATHDGDFGYDACSTELAGNGAVATAMRTAGYSTAVLFGSKNNAPAYDFIDLATDTDALGFSSSANATHLEARPVVVYTSANPTTPTTTFGSTPVTRTIGNVVNVGSGGEWRNGGYTVVDDLATGTFWSFTYNQRSFSVVTCSNATSNTNINSGNQFDDRGWAGTSGSVDGATPSQSGGGYNPSCHNTYAVLCVAH